MIALEASRMLVMSLDEMVDTCAVKLASAAEVRLTLRSAETPSEISAQPR